MFSLSSLKKTCLYLLFEPRSTSLKKQTPICEERRRELYLEGHRNNDMLRFNLPFDTGLHRKGAPYGPTTCLPLPEVERLNNPNIGN